MKLILASNILEHSGFTEFLEDVSLKHADSLFCVTGDLLNVFPEPGEDIRGSICFELYGEGVVSGLDELVKTQFKDVRNSVLLPLLRDMFYPLGKDIAAAKSIARARYRTMFRKIETALKYKESSLPALLYIPGNMDYPSEAMCELANRRLIRQVDCEVIQLDGVKIGALGGIPNTAHPFRSLVEISPYEMHELEYARRLEMLWGVDVLLTHLSPSESPGLQRFVEESPMKLLICRAPFDFRRDSDFRGELEIKACHDKSVIMVRPFDYPINSYFVLDLEAQGLSQPAVQKYEWRARKKPPTLRPEFQLG